MGREVRLVPANWEHPRDVHGNYRPLHNGLTDALIKWDEGAAKWTRGEFPSWIDETIPYAEWAGPRPEPRFYMPEWPIEACTHLQMYETCSEGTPISPVCAAPEELACWLFVNRASAVGRETASYDSWLRVARGGYAPAIVVNADSIMSGVDGLTRKED